MLKEQILSLFPSAIRKHLQEMEFEKIQEIRIRRNRPLLILKEGEEVFKDVIVTEGQINEIIGVACGYSGYAFEEEIRRGYITMAGGHRIGLAGRAVVTEGGLQTLKYFSALNIRIAHPVTDCAKEWIPYFYGGEMPCHVLIISPPGCGKTTLLRDAIRMVSNGGEEYPGVTVGVVDERSEIAGSYRGVSSHDLGIRTDVLDGCPKALGMEMLLRSMSPKVLAVDEIGINDVNAIENVLRCGCKVFATLHGETLLDFLEKPGFEKLAAERVFERYVFLEQGQTPGMVRKIYGKNFEILWEV